MHAYVCDERGLSVGRCGAMCVSSHRALSAVVAGSLLFGSMAVPDEVRRTLLALSLASPSHAHCRMRTVVTAAVSSKRPLEAASARHHETAAPEGRVLCVL